MKSKLFTLIIGLLVTVYGNAQMSYTPSEKKAMDALQEKITSFKKASNDSMFVVGNSDKGFYYVSFHSGDQKEDIDKEIFSAKVGDVVGPFRGDTFCYIFKVVAFSDTLNRAKANLIHFKPKEFKSQQELDKTIEKYLDALRKGKDVFAMAVKEDQKLSLKKKDLGWYWETISEEKEYFNEVFSTKKGDPLLIKNSQGIFFLDVVEEKKPAAFKVMLIPVVKKI
ncbi:MAG: hypothetical protein ACK40G_10845 [Cytophagaceae bacterium]